LAKGKIVAVVILSPDAKQTLPKDK